MKNTLIVLFLIIIMSSCVSVDDDLNSNGYNYTVIDTTHTSRNGFNVTLGYDVIIEQDSTLYSAFMGTDGTISKLDRKLKVKKCK